MNTFTLRLLAADSYETIENVESFSAEDATGSFNLLPRHERFMTVLSFGLTRFRLSDGRTEFLGLPGGVLYFSDNVLNISTRRCLRDTDPSRIAQILSRELLEEERELEEARHKLRRLEAEMVRRLSQLGRE